MKKMKQPIQQDSAYKRATELDAENRKLRAQITALKKQISKLKKPIASKKPVPKEIDVEFEDDKSSKIAKAIKKVVKKK